MDTTETIIDIDDKQYLHSHNIEIIKRLQKDMGRAGGHGNVNGGVEVTWPHLAGCSLAGLKSSNQ